jgi:phage baseplate assembly protein W
MAREFVGRGWSFPILPDEMGRLSFNDGDANVEQCLRILLLTRFNERTMRASFGSDAPRLVFAPGSERYLRLLETSIREAVRDWEPRVDLDDVRAERNAADETHITVSIAYRVRPTNSKLNLVFPFYLETP